MMANSLPPLNLSLLVTRKNNETAWIHNMVSKSSSADKLRQLKFNEDPSIDSLAVISGSEEDPKRPLESRLDSERQAVVLLQGL